MKIRMDPDCLVATSLLNFLLGRVAVWRWHLTVTAHCRSDLCKSPHASGTKYFPCDNLQAIHPLNEWNVFLSACGYVGAAAATADCLGHSPQWWHWTTLAYSIEIVQRMQGGFCSWFEWNRRSCMAVLLIWVNAMLSSASALLFCRTSSWTAEDSCYFGDHSVEAGWE